jgi:citrate lyase subunit beta/citryl-CoA lyase
MCATGTDAKAGDPVKLRSMLFVPADSEKKLQKSDSSLADALIFDLEDSVAPSRKATAREMCAAHLQERAGQNGAKAFVRINPLKSPLAMQDLAAVIGSGIAGIVLPKVNTVHDIHILSAHILALELRAGLPSGGISIVAIATETARSMLNMAGYSMAIPRLIGLTWGAEDLSTDIGAATNRESDGALSHLYLLARSMCLLAASAAQAAPIDTLYADFRDSDGLAADCVESRRRGFTGRIAIHPDQVDIINRCYTPSASDLATAQAVVHAFAADPDLGTVGIDGRMYDRPHLLQAHRTLAMAGHHPAIKAEAFVAAN